MDITKFAVEKRQFTLLLVLVVFLLGAAAYVSIPRAQDPGFIIRAAQVITHFPGAGAERVDQLVTNTLEEQIRQIPELDYVQSESKTGVSIITVSIKESYDDMRPIWDSLRRKVEEVVDDLPEGASVPIVNDDFGDVYGIVYAITGDGFSYSEIEEVADTVRDELLQLDDVAKVELLGAQEERIYLEYNLSRIAEFGLSPQMLSSALANRNIINSGGEIYNTYEMLTVEPTGSFDTINDLAESLIEISQSKEVVALSDIVTIKRGYLDPPRSLMSFNGEAALGLAVSMRAGGNITTLSEQVRLRMDDIILRYPLGIEFNEVSFEADVVNKTVSDFSRNLNQAIVVVTLVMLVFLGLRTGFIVGLLIPITIATSFLIMSQLSIGIDQISLAALMISLGLLVDNAIVMAESILVRLSNGQEKLAAALDAAAELKLPLLTSSLTTAAAFLPVYLAESALGEYTAPLFKVVAITLLSSLLVALTVIPLLCILFMKVKAQSGGNFFERINRVYGQILAASLRFPLIAVSVALLLFAASIASFSLVPKVFFPAKTDPIFTLELEFEKNTPIEYTQRRVADLEAYINDQMLGNPEVGGIKNWASFIGNGGVRFVLTHAPKPASSGYAFLLFNTTEGGAVVDNTMDKLSNYLTDHFDDARITLKKLENGTSIDYPVSVRISGAQTDKLFEIASTVKQKLSNIPGAQSVSDDWGLSTKKVRVDIDSQLAQRANLTHSDIAASLRATFGGIPVTEYREGDKIIPVILRSEEATTRNYTKVGALGAISSSGLSVPLSTVARSYVEFQPAQVFRRNGAKTIAVTSLVAPGVTAAEINNDLIPWLEEQSNGWPPGYQWELGGEAESSGKANRSIIEKLPIAGFIIFLLLMAQFNCIRRTLIILLTIPLALIGVIFGLLVMNSYFGFMTLLGIISLAGIVINNAIVLLDRIDVEFNQDGVSWYDAVINAAHSRLRPILLTTFTTVLGLIPLYLGGGPMWEPMAVTIIFGLLVSTILTLAVVPALFCLFFGVRRPMNT